MSRYLAFVRDVENDVKDVGSVPMVGDFFDVFPEELLGLPLDQEIEFAIDVLPGMKPISIPSY